MKEKSRQALGEMIDGSPVARVPGNVVLRNQSQWQALKRAGLAINPAGESGRPPQLQLFPRTMRGVVFNTTCR